VVRKEAEIHPLEMERDSQGRKRFVSAKAVAQPFQAGPDNLHRLEPGPTIPFQINYFLTCE
jgi:hypothetical protein